MIKPNNDIRKLAKKNGVSLWQLADEFKVGEATIYRWLRHDLPEDKKAEMLSIIERLSVSI